MERVPADPRHPLCGEHLSRYQLAATKARGARVLDAGCGTGFGAATLARAGARLVIGLDVSEEAVVMTSRTSTTVVRGDAMTLPFRDNSFGLVTCFETIEHVVDPEALVAELRRVAEPAAHVFVSTPNGDLTGGARHLPANPFHVREFEPEQLRRLLRRRFARVSLYGQLLSNQYRIAPMVQRPAGWPGTLGSHRWLLWRVQSMLPFALRERLADMVSGRSFYPGSDEFRFDEENVTEAHAIVAHCQC